jgi:hypothetical protein
VGRVRGRGGHARDGLALHAVRGQVLGVASLPARHVVRVLPGVRALPGRRALPPEAWALGAGASARFSGGPRGGWPTARTMPRSLASGRLACVRRPGERPGLGKGCGKGRQLGSGEGGGALGLDASLHRRLPCSRWATCG